MVGPTRQGVADLIAQDPSANWTYDPFGGRYPRGTVEGGMGMASPRLAMMPLFDPDIYMAGHQNGRIQAGNAELKQVSVPLENGPIILNGSIAARGNRILLSDLKVVAGGESTTLNGSYDLKSGSITLDAGKVPIVLAEQ